MQTVSIITPTSDREEHLRLQYENVKKQEGLWEWLICDSSFRPSPYFSKLKDKRVKYIYDEENLKIGKKRNLLIEQAQGDYITHFDDDDYYSPLYVKRVRKELEIADFFKFTNFFCYSTQAKSFFYWDTHNLDHASLVLSPTSGKKIREIDFSKKPKYTFSRNFRLGYGFSYSYRREVAEQIKFKNVNFKEDYFFIKKAIDQKFRVTLVPDTEGFVVHIIHDLNSSASFPQYRIPPFMCENFFPNYKQYIKKYPKPFF